MKYGYGDVDNIEVCFALRKRSIFYSKYSTKIDASKNKHANEIKRLSLLEP